MALDRALASLEEVVREKARTAVSLGFVGHNFFECPKPLHIRQRVLLSYSRASRPARRYRSRCLDSSLMAWAGAMGAE